jgi:hypothetical protein
LNHFSFCKLSGLKNLDNCATIDVVMREQAEAELKDNHSGWDLKLFHSQYEIVNLKHSEIKSSGRTFDEI